MDKKAIIFDLDGTLVDTLSDISSAVNEMLVHFNLPVHTEADICRMIGTGARNLIRLALPEERRNDAFVDETLEYYRGCYDRSLIVNTRVYKGLYEVLCKFRDDGVKMAILSNKDDGHVKAIVNALLPDLFLYANGFSPLYPRKPSPEAVIALMDKLGVKKEETAFVGDSSVDIQTGRNAGILSVGVTWGFGGKEAFLGMTPDVTVDCPEQLLDI